MPRQSHQSTAIDERANWICTRLDEQGSVTKADFINEFFKGDSKEETLSAEWHKLQHGIYVALKYLKIQVEVNEHGLSSRRLMLPRYNTSNFRRDEAGDGKKAIGRLVAKYLNFEEHAKRSIFLGSGSTIFEVGEAMIEEGPYSAQQLFWTVNIALVSRWCEIINEEKVPPVRKISIPGGTIEPEYFRFATMKTPGWPAVGIVVIGADGCLVKANNDKRGPELHLYANSTDTAANTNTFIGLADHALVCCLSADKIGVDLQTGPGPEIELPAKSSVMRLLMTDKAPDSDVLPLFEANNWMVIWEREQLQRIKDELTNREKAAAQKKINRAAKQNEIEQEKPKTGPE